MRARRVAVVGGGIGGLVLGLALREHGVEFDIYEQADELREVGAAVALSANGTRELHRLGLGDAIEAVSVRPARYEALRRKRTATAQRLSRLTADLLHVPDGPDIPGRDAAFADLYEHLAWIHGHDAHASTGNNDLAAPVAERS